jgi:transposase
MSQKKYIGMDVHQATISVAVMDGKGKLIIECVLETKAATILEFMQGLQGSRSVTFEEGTSAAWLHDLLKPHVHHLVVCDPRKNALLKDGSKSDRIDARKLAELLRSNQLKPVYHGEHGVRTLKELGRSYLTITKDLTRVMNRIKALYRSWAIPCSGTTVYAARHRAEWLAKILETRSSSSSGTVIPATGWIAACASGSTTGPTARESQAPCGEIAAPDSFDRSDSCRLTGRAAADATPFP